MNVMIAGGGTGGHLMPALALADALVRRRGDVRPLFVGTRAGIETEKVPAAGYDLFLVRGGQVKGVGAIRAMKSLVMAAIGTLDALGHVRRLRPRVVVCVGGYAAFAAGVAARLARLPLVVLEQNAIPGRTNRFLSRLATFTAAPFDAALARLGGRRKERLGNPVRASLIERFRSLRKPVDTDRFRVFVFGGSQGAHRLNEAAQGFAERAAERLDRDLALDHQTGGRDFEAARVFYEKRGLPVRASAFIDNMAEAYAGADLVVCRAGATSIAELCALGLPSVLVPYPYAADDHQRANAAVLAEAGAARVVEDSDFQADTLFDLVETFRADRALLTRMAEAAARLGAPEAADVIADRVLAFCGADHVS